ncbi:helix-turn-helix domain-containing protein [Nocardia uniformis]|uniref:Helix-turn-helix domain-containing protein n=1 Tax=Nocardia uniformis TaxID=53432 RepID=A0A849CBJ3_9NOCA|nr:hypothetical protein [Nocardia uniformis]NNH75912.1 helix-turn-helix domain-containing protein [Nocardia uniformis]
MPRRRRRHAQAKGTFRTPQRLERRLSRTEKSELIQAYRDGASAAELAHRYRASKSAILELLTKHKVPRRYQSMTDADIERAEQLYLAGHSLTACAELTGFPASSINRALNKRGTPMRPAGRPRSDG